VKAREGRNHGDSVMHPHPAVGLTVFPWPTAIATSRSGRGRRPQCRGRTETCPLGRKWAVRSGSPPGGRPRAPRRTTARTGWHAGAVF
jgi:hypothetical protein